MWAVRWRHCAPWLALLWPGLANADAPGEAQGLRIEDAVHLALRNNERALKAPLRVEIAEGQLDRARDAFLPTLVASGTSTYDPASPRPPDLTHNGTVTLTQPLLVPSAFPLYS